MRLLPEMGDVGKDLITAMGVNVEKFEGEAMKMFAGKLTASPFPPEEIKKGKEFLNQWCESWGYETKKREGRRPRGEY